jgi:transcriptional regulator with GAF, ATPase, and Fis domain
MPDTVNRRLLDVLTSLAEELVTRLDADACAISRVIGDVLIMVAEKVPPNRSLLHGQGYLVSEYPQTAEVLATGVPRALTLDDRDLDDGEAAVLRDQGFASLVMVPLIVAGERWGLVEVYRIEPRAFDDATKQAAVELSRI